MPKFRPRAVYRVDHFRDARWQVRFTPCHMTAGPDKNERFFILSWPIHFHFLALAAPVRMDRREAGAAPALKQSFPRAWTDSEFSTPVRLTA